MGYAMGYSWIDGVFGDIALNTVVVIGTAIFSKRPSLNFHFVCGLPCPYNDLSYATHGLGIRGNHGEGAKIMEDIFGGDGLAANTRFRKGDVFCNIGV